VSVGKERPQRRGVTGRSGEVPDADVAVPVYSDESTYKQGDYSLSGAPIWNIEYQHG
jgi:hypothetical protein